MPQTIVRTIFLLSLLWDQLACARPRTEWGGGAI
jgi:hypothetical protein